MNDSFPKSISVGGLENLPKELEWIFDPRDIGKFLFRNKLKIASAFLIGAMGGYFYSLTMPNRFKVSATILPQQASESRLSGALSALGGLVGGGGSGGDGNSRVYPVIIKSRRILKPVLDAEFGGKTFRQIFIDEFKPAKYPEETIIGTVQRKILEINVDRSTGVTTLTVTYSDPAVAAAFANALILQLDHFFNFQYQTAASMQKKMMESRLESVTDSLRIYENRLADFLNRNRSFEHSPDLTIQEMRLRRNLEVQSTLYKELIRQGEAVKFNELSMNPVLNVLDEAVPATEKSGPIRRKIAAICGIVATMFAMVVIKLISLLLPASRKVTR